MKHSDQKSAQAVADEILVYLRQHPNAKDTAEGIRNWWLADAKIPLPVVKQALGELVVRKLVVERSDGGGKSYFSLEKSQ